MIHIDVTILIYKKEQIIEGGYQITLIILLNDVML